MRTQRMLINHKGSLHGPSNTFPAGGDMRIRRCWAKRGDTYWLISSRRIAVSTRSSTARLIVLSSLLVLPTVPAVAGSP